jgi:hypothetical protein
LIRTDLTKGFRGTEKYNWKEISSITTDQLSGMTFIRPNNGHIIPMSSITTNNYYQVLAEIVDLLRRNNPNSEIDDETLKRLSKDFKQKQMYFIIVLMLLFILMWAIIRLHWFVIL